VKLSVLISVYGKENPEYLTLCLQSLAAQTHEAEEVVLVEDGPLTPELQAVIERHRVRLNIKSIKLQDNCGLAVALNEGMKHCSYPLVARMDSDDICQPQRFERQVSQFLKKPDLDVLGCFATEIDAGGSHGALRAMPVTHEAIKANLWTSPFIHPTVMFRRDKILALGGYDESLRRRQDYELWFRCAKAGFKFANIPEPLILYRFDQNTHKKQPVKLALEQALIGYRGASLAELAAWKRLACFVPFFRSLLPSWLQHFMYLTMRKFDPRQKNHGRTCR